MQEHIRRAHPEHYISKLPATEESFLLMVNSPPSERPAQPPAPPPGHHHQQQNNGGGGSSGPQRLGSSLHQHGGGGGGGVLGDHNNKGFPPPLDRHNPFLRGDDSAPGTPRGGDDGYPGQGGPSLLPAAAALAQLHNNNKIEHDWDSEGVGFDFPPSFVSRRPCAVCSDAIAWGRMRKRKTRHRRRRAHRCDCVLPRSLPPAAIDAPPDALSRRRCRDFHNPASLILPHARFAITHDITNHHREMPPLPPCTASPRAAQLSRLSRVSY